MSRLFSISIDTFSFLVILLPVYFIFSFTLLKQQSRKKKALVLIFALYLSAVFSATGIPNIQTMTADPSFNWIPFLDIAGSPARYFLARLCLGNSWKNTAASREKNSCREPYVILVIVLILMFFLQPFIAGSLWEFILAGSLWENLYSFSLQVKS